jgi:pyruvate,water dikinase
MPEKKEAKTQNEKIDFIKWFSELNKDSGSVAGGKGANLGEIFNLKIPVPPGFVVTAQAYNYFIEKAGIDDKIKELLSRIEYEDTSQLNKIAQEIRVLIESAEIPKEMQEEIFDAYENLDTKDSQKSGESALDILRKSGEPIFVAVRSSATTEDLADASFAGQQDTFLNVKGKLELIKHVKKCFSSLFTPRATYYRNKKDFKHEESSLAVIVQKMIDADKSGVIFSKDPTLKKEDVIIEAVWGLGEGIVSGKITPDRYIISKDSKISDKVIANKKIAITRDAGGSKKIVKLKEERSKQQVLTEYEIRKLAEIALKLEEHYKKPQDIEFAIEGEEIYIVQTRPITTLEKRADAGASKELQGEVILTGLAASPGIASGKIKIIENLEDLHKINQGDILVTVMTNPDMVVTMQKSAAIVTDEGGLTAHAAIVSREMGIPAIVGTQEATTKLKEGEIITVDGFTGKVYKGKTSETILKEVLPVDVKTKTEIKVIIDLPSAAERAAKSKLKKVGLLRIEGIIAENGKHPDYFLKNKNMKEYEEIIFKGVQKISQYFEELWIRTSDIRSDEFQNLEGAPKDKEANPMLGMHGIRYGVKNPEVLKTELSALKRVSEKGKKIGLLLPQVISVDEVKKVKELLKEIGFLEARVGIMIETPASVQLIREFCEEGVDFISFGTNDLTQYILAIDRGNQEVQHLYNEMNPAIIYQLEYVIRVCKRYNVETSICGQAGSKKEMVKFLVEKGIDSISVNADVASEIAKYVLELETGKKPETKEETPKTEDPEKKDGEEFLKPQNTEEVKEEANKQVKESPEELPRIKRVEAENLPEEPKEKPKEEIPKETIEEKEEPSAQNIIEEIEKTPSKEDIPPEKEIEKKEDVLDIF